VGTLAAIINVLFVCGSSWFTASAIGPL